MKLNEIKNLLADSIQTYSTRVQRQEGEDVYTYEYEIEVSKQDPTKIFMSVLFGVDNIYDALKDLDVEHIYCGKNGFIVQLITNDDDLFERIAKEAKIPLKVTKSIMIE